MAKFDAEEMSLITKLRCLIVFAQFNTFFPHMKIANLGCFICVLPFS